MSALTDRLRQLTHEVADLKIRLANLIQVGPVTDIDAEKGYRIDLGPDAEGKPRKSPFLPHPESGGKASTWMPLSEGQIMAVLAPVGDLRQAFLVRAGFGGGNVAPSADLGEVVLVEQGDVRVSVAAGRFTVEVGDALLELTPSKLEALVDLMQVTGESLKHNAKSIGDTHGHISAPPGPPGEPV